MLKKRAMTDQERELIFSISEGVPEAIRLIYTLRNIWNLSGYEYPYIDVLEYLKRTRIRGKNFVDMYKDRFENSQVVAAAQLQKEATKDFKLRSIKAGGSHGLEHI